MARVGIVICNYNRAEMVCKCIESVLESRYTDYKLFVVDNASTDDSVRAVREHFGARAQLVLNSENMGGSGGFNAGMRRVLAENDMSCGGGGYEYIWCLDNDVLVDENALGVLVEFLDAHPECGMAGSKVDHMEAPDYVQQYGLTIDFEHFCTVAKYRNHPEDGTLPEVVYSDAAAACSLLVRCSVIVGEIGLMPEDNFLYWDDTEWGYRCNLAGYKVASCGRSVVLHAMGAKGEDADNIPAYYAWRNGIHFFVRYTPKERLDVMCRSFLQGVFDVLYEGMYRNETGRAGTVMAAYDDALHGVRGKAAENRIYPADARDNRLRGILEGKKCALIEAGNHADDAEILAGKISALFPQMEVEILYSGQKNAPAHRDQDAAATVVFCMCGFLFDQEDLSLSKIYADQNGNFLATEEDALMVIHYPYSRRMFFGGQMPLFLRCAAELRGRDTQREGRDRKKT